MVQTVQQERVIFGFLTDDMPGKQTIRSSKVNDRQQATGQPGQNGGKVQAIQWTLVAILIATAILYTKAVFNGFTSLDDDVYLTNNVVIQDLSLHGLQTIFSSFYAGNYQPLTMLAYMLMYKLFGLAPLPYHLLNVTLHLINVALVFKLSERLSGKKATAIVVAVLFAVHPMHVESVAWVSALKDLLYSAFYLASLLAYLCYSSNGHKTRSYIIVCLLFFAALLCKSAAITLPVLLIVIDLYQGRKINSRALLEKVPLLALSVALGIVAIISQRSSGAFNGSNLSYGAVNSFFLFTSGLAFYFLWLVVPFRLTVFHNYPTIQNGFLPWPYYASLVVVLFVCWLVWKKNKFQKDVLFGMSFFLVAISVMLQVVSVGSALTAERYTYVSYIGLFYIVGQITSTQIANGKIANYAIGILSLFVIAFATETWGRLDVWKDDQTLFNDLVEKNPEFYFGYWLRGNTEKKEGKLNEAIADYDKTIALNPKDDDAYYNRGIIYAAMGILKYAIADYTRAIALNPKQPDTYNNRGWAYYRTGDTQSAIADFRQAIAINSMYAEAYNNLGWVYDQSGNSGAALEQYTKAIAANPQFTQPLYNSVNLNMKTGDLSRAIVDCNLLIKLHQDDHLAFYLRGIAYFKANERAKACDDWQTAMKLGNQQAIDMLNLNCR